MIRWILALLMWMVGLSVYCKELPNFFNPVTSKDVFKDTQFASDLSLASQDNTIQKETRYIGEDQPLEEKSFWSQDFYQDDDFRFYNMTQYSFSGFKNTYRYGTAPSQIDLDDLSISLGYGMEFRLSRHQRWGYEYLSSFPYDRGQSIRLFWKRKF